MREVLFLVSQKKDRIIKRMAKLWKGGLLIGLSALGFGFGAKPKASEQTKSNFIEENERILSRVHYAILDEIEAMKKTASESEEKSLKFPDGSTRTLESIRKDGIFFRNVVCEQFRLENLKQMGTVTSEDRVAFDTVCNFVYFLSISSHFHLCSV